MSTERKGTEVIVGLFLLIGFAFIAVMVVTFGRVGQGMRKFYPITVEFPNASGLVKGSDVLLAGARIGHVAEAPNLTGESFTVTVVLNIREDVKIPTAASFLVGSSGLLGDRFVDVSLKPGFNPAETIAPGARIAGTRAGGGLDELTSKGGEVMDQLTTELQNIQLLTARLREGVLHDQNLKNLEETFANLKASTESFKEASKGLNDLLAKAATTIDAASGTMKTTDAAAADLRLAIADIRKTADAATKTVSSTQTLIKQVTDGNGTLGTLIKDPKMADDLRALIANLRRSGVLFYRDRPVAATPPRRAR